MPKRSLQTRLKNQHALRPVPHNRHNPFEYVIENLGPQSIPPALIALGRGGNRRSSDNRASRIQLSRSPHPTPLCKSLLPPRREWPLPTVDQVKALGLLSLLLLRIGHSLAAQRFE